jgi:hypothetical protein
MRIVLFFTHFVTMVAGGERGLPPATNFLVKSWTKTFSKPLRGKEKA